MSENIANKVSLQNVMKKVTKPKDPFIALKELLSNSFEAIEERKKSDPNLNPQVILNFFYKNYPSELATFSHIEVIDNGIGFTKKNEDRFVWAWEDSKTATNKGVGRVQILYVFEDVHYSSIIKEDKRYRQITFNAGKQDCFISGIDRQAFDRLDKQADVGTKCTLSKIKDGYDEGTFNTLTPIKIRDYLLEHFYMKIKQKQKTCPINININFFNISEDDKNPVEEINLSYKDLEKLDIEEQSFNIQKSQIFRDESGEISIRHVDETESFCISTFTILKEKNYVFNTSSINIFADGSLVCPYASKVFPKTSVESYVDEGDRIIISAISGSFFDDPKNISDSREKFNYITEKDLKKKAREDLFSDDKVVLKEDIEKEIDAKLKDAFTGYDKQVQENRSLYQDVSNKIGIPLEGLSIDYGKKTDKKKAIQTINAEYAKQNTPSYEAIIDSYEELDKLDSRDRDFIDKLNSLAEKITLDITSQRQNLLAQYFVRRKLIIKYMEQLREGYTKIQQEYKEGGKKGIDEFLLHNLLVPQKCTQDNFNLFHSGLWMLNEEFMHFRRFTSEKRLLDIKTEEGKDLFEKGEKLNKFFDENGGEYLPLKKRIESEEKSYLANRPDILLFPEEEKVMIIEVKSPDVELTSHLEEIYHYAYIIHSLSKFNFKHYYGYLVGGKAPKDGVARRDGFKSDPKGNSYFRNKEVTDYFRSRGNVFLYEEVITFEQLIEKAKIRNKAAEQILGIYNEKKNDKQ